MLRGFGQAPYGRSDKHVVMSMFSDVNKEQFYTVMGNRIVTANPVSGNLSYSILKCNTVQPYGMMYGQTDGSWIPPEDVANSFHDYRVDFARLLVFYNGVKLTPTRVPGILPTGSANIINSAGGDGLAVPITNVNGYTIFYNGINNKLTIFFTSSTRTHVNSDVIETFWLSDNNLSASDIADGSFYLQYFNRTDPSITGILAASGYVNSNTFYNNALVFKNGLSQRPAVDYFINASGDMSFHSGALVATDIVEVYVLTVSNKQSRIGNAQLFMDDYTQWIMPTFPDLRLKEV
jgi:hypothetical protein